MSTRLYFHPDCLLHVAGEPHPEKPERLSAIKAVLDRAPLAGVEVTAPRKATHEELLRAHVPEHLKKLAGLAGKTVQLDPDTGMSPRSYDAALLAAGASVEATHAVLRGEITNAFALVRPPGHHAERDQAMGFCLFNNVVAAAEAARAQGLERVLIFDWDVHHGNGTQFSFYDRRDVLYASVHQFPFYPGTGGPWQTGEGAGAGYSVNAPLPGGQGDADYTAAFHELFLPVFDAFKPQLVLVSAGFDPHRNDPLGGMKLTERGFAAMASTMKSLAEAHCGGKLVMLLEGGYHLDALAQSVHACAEVLSGGRTEALPTGDVSRDTREALNESRQMLKKFWPALA